MSRRTCRDIRRQTRRPEITDTEMHHGEKWHHFYSAVLFFQFSVSYRRKSHNIFSLRAFLPLNHPDDKSILYLPPPPP